MTKDVRTSVDLELSDRIMPMLSGRINACVGLDVQEHAYHELDMEIDFCAWERVFVEACLVAEAELRDG